MPSLEANRAAPITGIKAYAACVATKGQGNGCPRENTGSDAVIGACGIPAIEDQGRQSTPADVLPPAWRSDPRSVG